MGLAASGVEYRRGKCQAISHSLRDRRPGIGIGIPLKSGGAEASLHGGGLGGAQYLTIGASVVSSRV